MADALSLIPAGAQYNNLRGALQWLKRLEDAGYTTNPPYSTLSAGRVAGWVNEIDAGTGRDADQIRDDIVRVIIGADTARQAFGINDDQFAQLVLGGNEGGINLSDLAIIDQTTPPPPSDTPTPAPPSAPPPPDTPTPTPPPETTPEPPAPVDWKSRVRALYPWLPEQLVSTFADEWANTGDAALALAIVRTSTLYDQFLPGIKRDDGSLRMTEAEYFSTKEAYGTLFREYGLNDQVFSDRFTSLIEGDVSPSELAARLGGAYEQIISNIPQVRDAYAEWFGEGGMSDAAIFASFIDVDVADAILNRRISIAQVGAEGLARGFDVDQGFAERLVSGGVSQGTARSFFVQAEGQLQTLDTLVKRHRDPDDTFDLTEFADANIFGDAAQNRRIQRVLRAEAASFSDQLGTVATNQQLQLTGLSQR